MIQLIVGEKGKGKTKILLSKVNNDIQSVNGNIVYLDKTNDHMYELNNKVRLINVKEYSVSNPDEFVGFILGIVSQDHDLEQIYFDNFLKLACIENDDKIVEIVNRLSAISDQFGFTIIASISRDEKNLPQELKEKIIESL